MSEWYRPAGSAARKGFDVAIDAREAGWENTGLHVATMETPGQFLEISTGDSEWLVLPLSGKARVEVGGKIVFLEGRRDPFSGRTDFAYVPVHSKMRVTTTTNGARIAFPHAKAWESLPFRRIPAECVTTELRGAGQASRQINNFGTPEILDADSIIACEVLTPAGNWSSYPPHKHDEYHAGRESALEEIYYFELRPTSGAAPDDAAFGYQRVYGTLDRPINVMAEVRSGDVVLVPHGWHGPSMAPPGYDMYYLNVMAASPSADREWLVRDDPQHAWVRSTWASEKVDPRLPFGGRR